MKKICTLALCLMLAVICVIALPTEVHAADVSNLEFALNEDGMSYSVSGFVAPPGEELTIPATYNDLPVTAIGDEAFYDCSSLTSVTIADSVASIGGSAFRNCSGLTSITIPDGVTYIGNDAFRNCSSLTSITIPDSVTSIDHRAFSSCSSLTSIIIPNSVTSIGSYAFSSCSGLTSITISDSVTSLGTLPFEDCSPQKLIIADGSTTCTSKMIVCENSITTVVIPDSVTSIGDKAFYYCSKLTSVTIPGSVASIGEEAFSYCGSLTSVTIPDSVTSIGSSAFYNCSNLTNVYITDVAAWLNISMSSDLSNPLRVNNNNKNLYINGILVKDLTIPDGVTSIRTDAFRYCSSLTSITIPDSVTSVGRYAFYNCSSLTSITIPDSVTSIDTFAFYNSYPQKLIIADGSTTCTSTIVVCKNSLTSVVIPDSVTSIGDKAFYNCTNLTSATIGDSVTSIGSAAFSGCGNLTSITIPDSVTSIGEGAFYNCSSLTSITIPDSVTSIGDNVFLNCSSLTDIYITDIAAWLNISMGNYDSNPLDANSKSKNLYLNGVLVTDLIIPDGVTSIRDYAFYCCDSITSITIPDSVTSIGDWAFYSCSSLTSVTIPDSVTSIGGSVFFDCSSLESAIIPDSVTSMGNQVFAFCSNLKSVNIPKNVSSIGYYMFLNCINLEQIVIPVGVTTIDDHAFYCCSSLTNITIPDSVTFIDDAVFSGCSSLTNITIPNSVASIGKNVFSSCSGLTSITIPGSVLSIGDSAFNKCTALGTVVIDVGVETIGNNLFDDCSSLKEICYRGTVDEWYAINNSAAYDKVKFDARYVILKNWDGKDLGTVMISQGETIATEFVPEKEADNTYTYTFSGWDPAICTGDMEATAQYTATYIDYTVTFCNWDGTELQSETYHYGDPVSAPADPVKPYNETHYYVFTGWDSEVSSVCDGNKAYTATYEEKQRVSVGTPVAPVATEITQTKIVLKPTEGYAYSMDGVNWQDSNIFAGLKADTQYEFYQRVKETAANYTSEISPVLLVKTLQKAENLVAPAKPIVADYNTNSITLVAREGYEYRLDNGKWTTDPVFTGLSANTGYMVYQRIAETPEELASQASEGVRVTTAKNVNGTTSATNFEKLYQYIQRNGTNGTLQQTTRSENYTFTYQLSAHNDYILFVVYNTLSSRTGVEMNVNFNIYPDTEEITVYSQATYKRNGSPLDIAFDYVTIDRSTYRSGDYIRLDEGGFMYITAADLSELTTTTMDTLCSLWDTYIDIYVGMDLSELGFVSFHSKKPSACDIPSGYHAGSKELRNQREALCVVDGYTGDYYCGNCGMKDTTGSAIPCVGYHSYDDDCDVKCNVCQEERKVTVDCGKDHVHNHKHVYSKYVSDKNATCTGDGTKTAKCDYCDERSTVADPGSKLSHSYTKKVTKPTCFDDGYTTYTCNCGDTYQADYVKTTGHSWGAWEETKPATETAQGEIKRSCSVCYREETRATEKLPAEDSVPQDNPFIDVAEGKFFYEPVLWAYYGGITTGKDATHFNPSGECTRAQVVTFLWRAAGEPAPTSNNNPFPDVPAGKYYTNAVLWAVEKGITGGFKDGTFGPNKTCTRAQIVTFLWRYAGEPAPSSMDNPFPDVDVDAYYGKAVLWAVENEITGGFKDGTFGPNKTCTRDQIVTFLYRHMVE